MLRGYYNVLNYNSDYKLLYMDSSVNCKDSVDLQ